MKIIFFSILFVVALLGSVFAGSDEFGPVSPDGLCDPQVLGYSNCVERVQRYNLLKYKCRASDDPRSCLRRLGPRPKIKPRHPCDRAIQPPFSYSDYLTLTGSERSVFAYRYYRGAAHSECLRLSELTPEAQSMIKEARGAAVTLLRFFPTVPGPDAPARGIRYIFLAKVNGPPKMAREKWRFPMLKTAMFLLAMLGSATALAGTHVVGSKIDYMKPAKSVDPGLHKPHHCQRLDASAPTYEELVPAPRKWVKRYYLSGATLNPEYVTWLEGKVDYLHDDNARRDSRRAARSELQAACFAEEREVMEKKRFAKELRKLIDKGLRKLPGLRFIAP